MAKDLIHTNEYRELITELKSKVQSAQIKAALQVDSQLYERQAKAPKIDHFSGKLGIFAHSGGQGGRTIAPSAYNFGIGISSVFMSSSSAISNGNSSCWRGTQ